MESGQSAEELCRNVSVNPDSDCVAQHTASEAAPWTQVAGVIMLVIVIGSVVWLVISQARKVKKTTAKPDDREPPKNL